MKLFILLKITVFVLLGQTYTVSRIQIDGNTHTRTDFIKQFITIQSGDRLTMAELKKEAKESERQLSNTFYFFQNKVIIIPLRKQRVKIIVQIREGFLYVFGGSEHGFLFGKRNIDGSGFASIIMAGLKVFSIDLTKRYIFNSKFNLGFSASTTLFNTIDPKEGILRDRYRGKTILASLGYSFFPDYTITAFGQYKETDFDHVNHDKHMLISGFTIDYKNLDNTAFPTDGLAVSAYYEHYNNARLALIKSNLFKPLSETVFTSFKLTAGTSNRKLDITRQFQFNHPNGLVAEYSDYNKGSSAYLAEFTINKFLMHVPFLFDGSFYAGAFLQGGELSEKLRIDSPKHSMGPRIALYIPIPVNLTIEAKYGFSNAGNKFLLTVGAGLGFLNEL